PEDTGGDPTGTAFSFRIFNNGPATLDLNHAELRYWFHVGDPTADLKPASVDGTQFGAGNVASDFVSVSDGYENCYLRVTFADTQPIESYRASGVVRISFDKTAAATPTPADATESPEHADLKDLRHDPAVPAKPGPARPASRDYVAFYVQGRLLWGDEP